MMKHIGVNSWFQVIQEVIQDFVSNERVVWVDIEGIPLHAWSRDTFTRIGNKWGETLNIEDTIDSSFGRKRLCISTKHPVSILESFKIIAKGKVFMAMMNMLRVIETKEDRRGDTESEPFIVSPPGFTPVGSEAVNIRDHVFGEEITNMDKEVSPMISAKGVLEEVIRVGQAMGYSMKGCEKDVESISGTLGEALYDSLGNSGGILCIWEESVFKKDYVTISDSFVAIYGTWIPNKAKILIVAIYAPQQLMYRRVLWDYMSILLSKWNGEVILMGDFNEVRTNDERRGSWFNSYNASLFDQFISSSGLVDVKMEGYAFTWSHPSANKMSKLDRFLVSDGVISLFPSITAIKDKNSQLSCSKQSILKELRDIDKELDQGGVSDSSLLRRHELKCQLNDIKAMEATDSLQKSKVRWAIEGDENSKYFHGIINKKRSHLAIRGVFD
ncbi:RNA-directed DNA polymerase, eukaryota [Tanacetum coccineum]